MEHVWVSFVPGSVIVADTDTVDPVPKMSPSVGAVIATAGLALLTVRPAVSVVAGVLTPSLTASVRVNGPSSLQVTVVSIEVALPKLQVAPEIGRASGR